MECKKCQSMISLYVDQQLNAEEIKDFEAHIAVCPECKEELEFMQNIMMHVHDLDDERELPSDFHESLMDKIDSIQTKKEATPINRFTKIRKYYSAFAAAFVAILIFGFIGITNLDNMSKMSKQDETAAPEISRSQSTETQENKEFNEKSTVTGNKSSSKNGNRTFDNVLYDSEPSQPAGDYGKNTSSKPNESTESSQERDGTKSIHKSDEPESVNDEQGIMSLGEGEVSEEEPAVGNGDSRSADVTGSATKEEDASENQTMKSEATSEEPLEGSVAGLPQESMIDDRDTPSQPEIHSEAADPNSISITFDANKRDTNGYRVTEEAPKAHSAGKTDNESAANTKADTQAIEDEQEPHQVRQRHNQAYIIIGIFGLGMLGVGFIIIARRKRR